MIQCNGHEKDSKLRELTSLSQKSICYNASACGEVTKTVIDILGDIGPRKVHEALLAHKENVEMIVAHIQSEKPTPIVDTNINS